MKFVEDFCESYSNSSSLYGYSVNDIFNTCSIFIVPMVNPDGVNLVTGAYSSDSSAYIQAKIIAKDYPNIPFPSGWKANITGVDLKNYQPICKVL